MTSNHPTQHRPLGGDRWRAWAAASKAPEPVTVFSRLRSFLRFAYLRRARPEGTCAPCFFFKSRWRRWGHCTLRGGWTHEAMGCADYLAREPSTESRSESIKVKPTEHARWWGAGAMRVGRAGAAAPRHTNTPERSGTAREAPSDDQGTPVRRSPHDTFKTVAAILLGAAILLLLIYTEPRQ